MERKADHSLKMIGSVIHNQILNYELTIAFCVYESLLPTWCVVTAFISDLINVN